MNPKRYVDPEKYARWEMQRFKRASFEHWEGEMRADNATARDSVSEFADMLRPVLLFLAKGSGLNPKATRGPKSGTLHMRAWVFLYAVRPDLIHGETMRAAAARFGVTPIRLGDIMREFRASVPHFDPGIEQRRHFAADPQAAAAAHGAAQARVWAQRRKAYEQWNARQIEAAL